MEGEAVTLCWLIEQRSLNQIGIAWDAQAQHLARQSSFLRDLIAQAVTLVAGESGRRWCSSAGFLT